MLAVVMVVAFVSAVQSMSCNDARMRCAFRDGCGKALQGYIMGCSTILHQSPIDECPEVCQHALIALTSTDEGKELMTCDCGADEVCTETKNRVEVCRPHVVNAVRNDSVVSCEIAQWICAADAQCTTALEYYHRYCQSMFHGRKCSYRCKNSISILRKQEKAAKLESCRCNGKEDYDCREIRTNMARLCFNKEPDFNQIDVDDKGKFDDGNENPNTATALVVPHVIYGLSFIFLQGLL